MKRRTAQPDATLRQLLALRLYALLLATTAAGCFTGVEPGDQTPPPEEGTRYIYTQQAFKPSGSLAATYSYTATLQRYCLDTLANRCISEFIGLADTVGAEPEYIYARDLRLAEPDFYIQRIGNWVLLPLTGQQTGEYADTLHTTSPGGIPLRTAILTIVSAIGADPPTYAIGDTAHALRAVRITTIEHTTREDGVHTPQNEIVENTAYYIAPGLGYIAIEEYQRSGYTWEGTTVYESYRRDLVQVESAE